MRCRSNCFASSSCRFLRSLLSCADFLFLALRSRERWRRMCSSVQPGNMARCDLLGLRFFRCGLVDDRFEATPQETSRSASCALRFRPLVRRRRDVEDGIPIHSVLRSTGSVGMGINGFPPRNESTVDIIECFDNWSVHNGNGNGNGENEW